MTSGIIPAAIALGTHFCRKRIVRPHVIEQTGGCRWAHLPEREHALLGLAPAFWPGLQDVLINLHAEDRSVDSAITDFPGHATLTQALADETVWSGQGASEKRGRRDVVVEVDEPGASTSIAAVSPPLSSSPSPSSSSWLLSWPLPLPPLPSSLSSPPSSPRAALSNDSCSS